MGCFVDVLSDVSHNGLPGRPVKLAATKAKAGTSVATVSTLLPYNNTQRKDATVQTIHMKITLLSAELDQSRQQNRVSGGTGCLLHLTFLLLQLMGEIKWSAVCPCPPHILYQALPLLITKQPNFITK